MLIEGAQAKQYLECLISNRGVSETLFQPKPHSTAHHCILLYMIEGEILHQRTHSRYTDAESGLIFLAPSPYPAHLASMILILAITFFAIP